MPKAVIVSNIHGIARKGADMAGLGGKKQICVRYKKGSSGKLRCAEKAPASRCVLVKVPGKSARVRICGGKSPISRRSKIGRRAKAGFVDGVGRCRTAKGRFKKGCKR